MNSIERIMCLEPEGRNGADESVSLESVLIEMSSVLSLLSPVFSHKQPGRKEVC